MTLRQRRGSARGDSGDTLIEILVTVIVLGITVTAVIGALTLMVTTSETHRRLSNAEVVTRAFGEKLVDTAMHAPATTLTADALVGARSVSVDPSVTFPATPFTASVDGEVVDVTRVSADKKTWTVSTLAEAHASGATAQQYYFYDATGAGTCPTLATFNTLMAGYTVPGGSKINKPQLTQIEFFDNNGNPIATGNTCDNYWSDTSPTAPLAQTICSGFASPEHLTECDPGLIRISLQATSTDTGATSAKATTSVLIRRGNA